MIDVVLCPGPTKPAKEYLGDGLYAEYGGWQFRLYAERDGATHEVYLEPSVAREFFRFVERMTGQRHGRIET